VFFADYGTYPLLESTGEYVFQHESCGNYGGLKYVKIMMDELKRLMNHITIREDDFVIFSDDDITMHKNPMELMGPYDHGGIFGNALVCDHVPHVSGQLNIVKGWLWNNYLRGGHYVLDLLHQFQSTHNSQSGTADDTLFSIFAYLQGAKQKTFYKLGYWTHDR